MSGVPIKYVRKYVEPSAVTLAGVLMMLNNDVSWFVPTIATAAPRPTVNTSASPARRAASSPRRSPYPLAATAVSPTLVISANETMTQIQKSDVDTAASPSDPIFVPTQNASTDEKSVINSDDATAGSAT